MKASVYACLAFSQQYADLISNLDLGDLTGAEWVPEASSRYSVSSPPVVIEFDDLGESISRYCRSLNLPDVRPSGTDVLAYIQVVPVLDAEESIRVYLGAELLSFLAEKGFGLDIHAQAQI